MLNNFDLVYSSSGSSIESAHFADWPEPLLLNNFDPVIQAGWNELSLFINGEVGTVWGKHSIFGAVYASSKGSNESAHCTG